MAKIIDISPLISEKIAVFPGDQAFEQKILLDFKNNNHLKLSSILTTVHLGAHVDASNHYSADGSGISDRDLNYYLGPVQIISVNKPPYSRINSDDIKNIDIKAQRILFKTQSYPNPDVWNSDFVSLSSDVVDYLAEKKVKLVGLDTPSVDLSDDPFLESHKAIHRHNMAILEGVILNQVSDGVYFLMAVPLKLKDLDASPVRALLIDGDIKDLC